MERNGRSMHQDLAKTLKAKSMILVGDEHFMVMDRN
jgi:hypothetical protein